MRTASAFVKDRSVSIVTTFLIVAAVVIGATACDGAGNGTYQLDISSASGGSVTTPGAGTFTYDAGMVVQLVAAPDEGYEFRSWTGDIVGIGDPNAASSTITMNGNYAVVANFETEGGEGPDGGGPDEGGPYS